MKTSRFPRFPRALLGLFVLALVCGGLFAGCMVLFARSLTCHELYCKSIAFDASGWRDEARRAYPEYVRVRMVDSLLKKGLVGRSREEIDLLIGLPDETTHFQTYDYVYWLGPERSWISIDSEWLGIEFSEDRVTEATILRD